MQVKNYCKKNQIPAQDIIDLLNSQYGGTWLLTSQLNTQIMDFLNLNFGNTQAQLPASKEQLQLPESKNELTVKSEQSTNNQNNDLTLADAKNQTTSIKRKIIKESAQIAAIEDYQTYEQIYESTARELELNQVYKHLEIQKTTREQFKASQLLRQQKLDQKATDSKDLTTQLLEVWENDSDDFINSFLNRG